MVDLHTDLDTVTELGGTCSRRGRAGEGVGCGGDVFRGFTGAEPLVDIDDSTNTGLPCVDQTLRMWIRPC